MRYLTISVFFILVGNSVANAATISGIVIDSNGLPINGASVALIDNKKKLTELVTSAIDGRYQMTNVQDGEYGITAIAPGVGAVDNVQMIVSQGKVSANTTVQLRPAVETVYGHITTPCESEIRDLKIVVQAQEGVTYPIYVQVVERDYRLSLPPGRYRITAMSTKFESSNRFLTIPSKNISALNIPLFLTYGSNPTLALEIRAMVTADQYARNELVVNGRLDQSKFSKVIEVDKKNQARLHEILSDRNWIDANEIGARGVDDLWILVQHDSWLLKECLPFMIRAANQFELPWSNVALSIDRVLVSDKKPQIYGSQLSPDETTQLLTPDPIEDELNVDKRRAELGMESLSEYLARFK